MISIENELKQIQLLIDNANYDNASVQFQYLINKLNDINSSYIPMVYYEYACFLFEMQDYLDAVPLFITAYELNFKKNTIIDLLYNCFITPNLEEFKSSYSNHLLSNGNQIKYNHLPYYDDLPLDFIPAAENIYYIYDKDTQQFFGKIDFSDKYLSAQHSISLASEFSDVTVSFRWSLLEIIQYVLSTTDRLLYCIPEDSIRTLSFLKLPNIVNRCLKHVIFFDTCKEFQQYLHNNPSVYLPRLLYGNNNLTNGLKKILTNEHNYRLSTEGRCTDNLLLSLCIPSWDRGALALKNVLSLLELPYDSEIEIVISNNGSTFYTEEYEKIKNLKDSRIIYSAFNTNQGFAANVAQVIHLSNAPFSLIISDEDAVIPHNLEHYLKILKSHSELAIVRSSTLMQYTHLDDCFASAGQNAFRESFLKGNYISGCIYNTKLFNTLDINCLSDSFRFNTSYNANGSYPHMWWDAILSFKGGYCSDKLPLICEGDSELPKQLQLYGNQQFFIDKSLNGLPEYSKIESRISQHKGFIELINILPFEDLADKLEGYSLLCAKTLTMFSVTKINYINAGYNYDAICEQFLNCLLDGINMLEPKIDSVYHKALENLCVKLKERLDYYR